MDQKTKAFQSSMRNLYQDDGVLNWSQVHCAISGLVPFKLLGFFRRYDIDKNEIGSGGYGKVWR